MKEKKKDENINEPIEEELPQQEAEDTEENTAEAEYVQPEAEEKEETPNNKEAEYLLLVQRIQADFDNYRKRNASVRADAMADGKA